MYDLQLAPVNIDVLDTALGDLLHSRGWYEPSISASTTGMRV